LPVTLFCFCGPCNRCVTGFDPPRSASVHVANGRNWLAPVTNRSVFDHSCRGHVFADCKPSLPTVLAIELMGWLNHGLEAVGPLTAVIGHRPVRLCLRTPVEGAFTELWEMSSSYASTLIQI
jgi:hypothetical protein